MLGGKSTSGSQGPAPYTPSVGDRQQSTPWQTQQNAYGGFQPAQSPWNPQRRPQPIQPQRMPQQMPQQIQQIQRPQQPQQMPQQIQTPQQANPRAQEQMMQAQMIRQQGPSPAMEVDPSQARVNSSQFGNPMAARQAAMANRPAKAPRSRRQRDGFAAPQPRVGERVARSQPAQGLPNNTTFQNSGRYR